MVIVRQKRNLFLILFILLLPIIIFSHGLFLIPKILSIPCDARVIIRPVEITLDTTLGLNFLGEDVSKMGYTHYLGLEKVRVSAGLIVLGSTLGFQKDGFCFLSSGMLGREEERETREG